MAEFKLGRIKFVYQGTWASNTSYVVDDVVTVGGKTYICVISNTSSSLFTTDLNNVTPYWNLIADGQSWKGSWSNSTYYNPGDMASYGGIVYTCNTAHTSASVNATISITSATSTSGAATLTFTALSSGIQPYLVGTSVTVSSFSNANFNGTFTVTACTATTVSFTIPGSYTGTGTTGSVVGTGVLGLELNQSNWTAFASSLNWTGTWSINTRYKLDDFVYYGGITYVCTTAHVSANTVSSGLEQDSSKWSIFNAGLNYLGTWQTSTRYKLNDIVKYGADLFICTTQHTSSGTAINTSNFSIFVNGFEFMNSWSSSNNYAVGDVVTYGGYTYTAIQNSTSGSPQIPSTATAYWQVFTTGLNYSGAWVTGTSYKIGNIVTLGAFTYVALADNSASQPTASNANWGQLTSGIRWNAAPNTTYTNVASSNVSATGSGSPTFDVTLSGTSYSAVIHTGSAGTGYTVNDTLKILGTALGGISPTNDLVVKVVSITGGSGTGPIATVAVVTGYAVTWKTGTTYVVGDAVYYGNSSYICISAHIGGAGVNDPISDTTATYWNILASGADSGALTTQGDIVYYGVNGPTRLPVGTDGQILRVNGNTPAWQYYGQLQNVVYVAPNGVDANTPGRGLTIDAPWASILYACKQIEDGYLNPNAGLLLKINKQFMMKETNNFILNRYSYNVTGTSASGNTFIVGGSSTSSQITTSTMYYGMPITFSAATGGVTPGTVYYVNSIPSSTTFTVSVNYQTGTPLGITPSSSTTSTATFNYSSSKAERDTGTVIDAVIFDLTHGGNLYVSTAAQAFFATITSFITTNATYEMPVWIASLKYLENTLFVSVLSNSAPSNNYQTLNGISSGNRAVQNITSVTSIETGSATIAQNLLDIITSALTAGTYANIPQLQRPHTSIYVKTGTYNEYGPIVVPQDTAILGDELRSTIVQVAGAQPYLTTDVPKTVTALQRVQSSLANLVANTTVTPTSTGPFPNTVSQVTNLPAGDTGNTSAVTLVSNNIAIIQNMFSGNTVITGPNNSAYPNGIVYQPAFSMPTVTGYNTSYLIGYGYAVTQLQNNYQFITDEIRNFLNNDTNLTGSAAWTNYSSTYQAETFRDLSNILDALQYDLTYGCNDQSMIAGRAFYSLNTALLVSPWLQGVKEALGRLSLILQPILLATPTANWNASYGISVSSGNTTSQSTSGTAGSAAAVSFAQSRITDILNWINTGFQDTSAATFTGSISSTTLTVSSVTGTIKIGQVVTGGTVAAGTYITAGSGTSWTVSVSQTATATGSTITISPVASGAAALAIAANLASFNAIQAQKQLIQNDAQAWVQRFFQNESPSLTLTNRDAGYIVDALSYDVLFNSNFNSIINGRAFNRLIPLVAALQANFADATYGSIGFIGSKVKLIAANGAVAQTSAVIDNMISQLRGQPTNNASLTGTVNGIQLSVSNISNGILAAGMALTGTGINSGTSLVSGATISITGAYISSTSGVFSLAAPLTTALVVGQQVTISGTFSAGSIATPSYVSGTTYYVIGNPTTSTFQLSATQGGSAVTTTTGGSSGSPITGITITASPTTWLLNYSQSVSSTTTAITTVSPTTNYVTMGTTTGMVPGLQITISGTSISNLTAGTYYIKQVLSATQLTLSQSYNGSVFAITANNTLSSVQITGTNGQFSCSAVSTSLAIGQPVVISGTFGGTGSIVGYTTPTTYYIIATNGSTTFTLSTAAGGSAIVTTVGTPSGLTYTVGATGAMTAVVYGIYGGLGLTTSITASGTAIPVSAVTTSTNLITVSSNANMYVNMPIVFAGLPSNITTTATTISSSSITLGGTVSSLGVVVGQQVWFTGVMPAATGTTGTITFNQVYYVKTASASAITISATLGGTALTLNNATGLSLTATFNAAGGLVNGTQYWVNSVTAGTYPAAGTTITVTNTYKSGTAFVITNSLTGLTATCTVGIPTPQYIASKIVNGTAQVWGNPTSSYQSYPGYNNTLTTINGAEIIRANKTFLATEAVAYVSSVYSATVTGTTASTNIITTSSAHNFVVGDVIQFVAGGGAVFGNLPSSPVWVLSTPSNTTFTISSTQPGTGTQTAVTMTTTSGSCTAVYYILTDKAVRDASYHIDGLVYDLGLTGNYKSLRSAQLYLTAVNGSTTVDLFHVRNGTGIRNMTLNGLTGSLGLPNNLGTRRPTAGAYTSLDPGFGPNDSSVWANIRSCYVQNVTNFGNGCVGLKIDAALHNGGNKSILGNDYTQVLSDGIGVWATGHGALTECVSVFNYYCYSGYLAEYGARIRATNGNCSYGFYGVIAEGTDSFETPIYATLNNRYNQAYITNVVTDAANQIYRIEYENAGNGYTNGVPSISGAGYNAAAVQDEYRDSAVFETRLVDLNNGQGVGGSNYLTATNVAQIGAVGSITIANSDTQLSSAYVGMRTQITAGSGVGQYANIISYRSDTKIANIVRPTFATLTITNSSTSVFTVATTNTLYASQPIYIGAAVAGLSTATVYYVVGASLSNNGTTFSVATTAANAASNTAITLTATSLTPAVLAGCTIVGTALTITSVTSGTIYVGMLLTGTGIAANTYIVSGSGLNWVVSVSQNLASTGLTGTISVPLYEAGWDHAIPGASVQPVLDATSTYIIEPAVSYTGPGFKSAVQTLSGSGNTWSGLTYGAGYFVATATSASVTSYSTNGTTWTSGGALPASTSWSNVVYGGGQGATATAVVGGIGGSGAILTPVLGSGTTSGQIVSITVTNGGYNYTTPPTIVITDASGTGATAICQVLNGTIQSVTMVVTGSLYANPTVTVVTSELSSITANTWGQNYFSAPTVTIAAPFTATAWSNGGSVTAGNYYYYVDTTVSPNVRNYYLASGTGTTFSSTAPTFTNAIYGKSGYGAPGTYSTGYGTNVTLTYAGTLTVAVANLTNNGVSSFTVTQSGFGYTTAPAITVVDPYAGFLAISSASTANAWNLPSTLGSAWTNNSNVLPTSTMTSLAYGNNLFIAVGGSGSAAAASLTNTTGPSGTWVNQSSAIIANTAGYSRVAYGNGTFVAIGGTVSAYMTANPAAWTSAGAVTNKTWTGLAYGNGRFVALANDGTLQYNFMTWGVTSNGSASSPTWLTVKNNPLNTSGITTWSNLRYSEGLFVAIATSSQTVATSWDGLNWSVYTSTLGMPSSSNWTNIAFGNLQNATLGAVPTWVAISNTSGTIAATIQTGATPAGRAKVVNNQVSEIRMIEPGGGFPRGNASATTTSTNVITVDSTVNLTANQPIVFNGTTTGSGITAGTYYYVVGGSITTTQFQISLTAGGTAIPLNSVSLTGVTYFASPTVTITDPNHVNTAPVVARIGNGVLGNPSFSNRGTSNSTATASYSGDGYADLYQTGTFINVSGLYQIPTAGCNVTFSTIPNTWYKLVAVTNVLGLAGNYTATFQINPGLSTLLAPVHNTQITTNLLYSNARLTGHDFLYIGTGGFTSTNYPNVDATKAVQANQQLQTGGGRVFFTSTDQDGNFNVGNLFGVQQSTGTATLNASAFNLSGLQSLTLGSVSLGVGSATITQFSTDPYFTANSDSVVPTQKAIKAFITAQIGGGQSTLNVNTITSGQIYIAGNTIQNTTGNQIYVSSKMLFTGGIDGSPVALLFFTQK